MALQHINFTKLPAVAVRSMANSIHKVVQQYDEDAILNKSKFTESYYIEDLCTFNGVDVTYEIRVSDHAKPGYPVENLIRVQEDGIEIEVFNAEGAQQAREAIVSFFNSIKK